MKVVGAAVALGLSLALSAAEAPFVSAHAGAMGTRANTLESVKARGMRLSLWTANSPETFDQCVKQGAYNVTTTWIPPKLANTPAPPGNDGAIKFVHRENVILVRALFLL